MSRAWTLALARVVTRGHREVRAVSPALPRITRVPRPSPNPPASCSNSRVLYQSPYPATGFAHWRLVMEARRSGICISLFQAPEHASTIAS